MIEAPATIDVMLTDIVLPGGIDGVTLVREALRRRPSMSVLCMSGYAPSQKHSKWLSVQNIRMLDKPFSLAQLAEALDAILPGPPRQSPREYDKLSA
jgi:DNA-binding NtrC family response regulator